MFNGTFENPFMETGQERVRSVLLALLFACVTANQFIIYIVYRTEAFRTSTGPLLINECIADTCMEALVIVHVSRVQIVDTNTTFKYMAAILSGFHGIVIYSLTAIGFNLYLAICHATAFKRHVTWKRIVILIVIFWMVNLSTSLLTLASDQIRIGTSPNYSGRSACLWVVFVINTHLLPLSVTIFSFIKITLQSKKTLPVVLTRLSRRNKIVLSRLITGLSIYYITASFMTHLMKSLYLNPAIQQYVTSRALMVFVMAMYLYHVLKLPFYFVVYKPFRQTVKEMFRWCASNIEQEAVPGASSELRRPSRW